MAVRSSQHGSVRLIRLDRPERLNAIDRDTATALADAFRAFDEDDSAAVAVLSGGPETFCSGADLKAFAAGRGNRLESSGDGPLGPTRMSLSKPVIAAIEGYAVAGGLELAIWCDLRVCADDATLGVFCRQVGVPLIDGGTVRLPRLIGHGRAMDLILTGRAVRAQEALDIGLVSRVVPAGSAESHALALAAHLAAQPRDAMLGDRRSAIDQWALDEPRALEHEFALGQQALHSGSARRGADRFARGARPPRTIDDGTP